MKTNTTEQALESLIEKRLTGNCLEDSTSGNVSEAGEIYGSNNGFIIGEPNNFNKKYAIDEVQFWNFLESTQKDELAKLHRHSDWKLKILERYDRMIKKYGVLHLLKKGLEVDDAEFILFYQLPLASSSQTIKDNFEENIFSETRQLKYSIDNPREEIDMVVFINGIPIITMELKNHWTGQNARVHGIEQYKTKRDIKQPLLNFARCIVHFAADTEEVYMTTKLAGAKTFFLPFNKGNNNGKGNPPNPNGHRSAYLWEEIFSKASLANIIQHFVLLDGKKTDALSKKTLFFPRYQQLDVVRKIVSDTYTNGTGKTYLIQHSAGSGKSNSITWAAFQLIETYPESEKTHGFKSLEKPLFDSVIVVTDRRLLDKQIRENIKQFSEVKNIVAPAHSSKELRESLEQGKKIIITTIQKFPFIIEGISDLSDKNFAVIIDEAHSSQSGSAHDNMNRAMGEDHDNSLDAQDKIIEAMKSRKMRGNASYFAFTATPKSNTLEKFGVKQADGSFKEFHLYSMKQAIEEGFILDVISNYNTYKGYYKIEKSISDNPLFDTQKAQKKLRAYVEGNQQTIDTKAEIILDHFMPKIVNTKKLKGKAKAMIITQSIVSAIKYYKAVNNILDNKGNPFKVLIAFSGEKELGGIKYSEAEMNGFSEKDTSIKFDTDEYRILIVANKYLTGFDQPKLCAMYVDKKLQGVLAVQALSRLNRSANKLGKRTEDIFVLDFFNSVDDIKSSFDPFYTSTTLSEATDINVLHELKEILNDAAVYEWDEVEDFNEKYFSNVNAEQLSAILDVAAYRFNQDLELEDDDKADFKIKAKQFVKIYGQMAAIMEFENVKWEKLYWFLKFLIPKLIVINKDKELLDELLESIDLSTYGIERVKLNEHIEMDEANSELSPQNPNPRGAHGGESEVDDLESIIKDFNTRWFSGIADDPEEGKVKIVSIFNKTMAHKDFESKVNNNVDVQNRDLAFRKIVDEVILKQRRQEIELSKRYANDESFNQALFNTIKRMASNAL